MNHSCQSTDSAWHSGSERHNVKIFNLDGTFLSSFEPYSSFLQQSRSAPISATAFHPHRMMLACAALHDNHINLFSCVDQPRASARIVPDNN